jgi:hypothetical protein
MVNAPLNKQPSCYSAANGSGAYGAGRRALIPRGIGRNAARLQLQRKLAIFGKLSAHPICLAARITATACLAAKAAA